MARARATYLSEREKDLLHEKTLEVFEKVGVAYKTPQAIELLASAGAEVDRDALTAKLTWDIIEPCLKTAPKKVLLAGRRPEDDRALGEWPLHTTTDGIQTYVYDDLTGRRPASDTFFGAVFRHASMMSQVSFAVSASRSTSAPADASRSIA